MLELTLSFGDNQITTQGTLSSTKHPPLKADNGKLPFIVIDYIFTPNNPLPFNGDCIIALERKNQHAVYDQLNNELSWRVRNYIN